MWWSQRGRRWQNDGALHAWLVTLHARKHKHPSKQTRAYARAHINVSYILLFHGYSGFVNAPQCYVIRTLHVLFRLVPATYRWRYIWTIDGMKLPRLSLLLGEKPVLVPLCQPQISRGLISDRNHASAVRGRRLNLLTHEAANHRLKWTWTVLKYSVCTAQWTPSLAVTKPNQLLLNSEIIAVCSEFLRNT